MLLTSSFPTFLHLLHSLPYVRTTITLTRHVAFHNCRHRSHLPVPLPLICSPLPHMTAMLPCITAHTSRTNVPHCLPALRTIASHVHHPSLHLNAHLPHPPVTPLSTCAPLPHPHVMLPCILAHDHGILCVALTSISSGNWPWPPMTPSYSLACAHDPHAHTSYSINLTFHVEPPILLALLVMSIM